MADIKAITRDWAEHIVTQAVHMFEEHDLELIEGIDSTVRAAYEEGDVTEDIIPETTLREEIMRICEERGLSDPMGQPSVDFAGHKTDASSIR